jgi:hypothetical protein
MFVCWKGSDRYVITFFVAFFCGFFFLNVVGLRNCYDVLYSGEM